MKVSCPSCQTTYNIDDKRIPVGGAKLKCAKCQTTFTAGLSAAKPLPEGARVTNPGGVASMSPLPPSAAPASAAAAGFAQDAVPLPGNAGGGFGGGFGQSAVPLPGTARASNGLGQSAVPLPGNGYGGDAAVPLPGFGDSSGAVPLPGFGEAPPPRAAARFSPATEPFPGPPRGAAPSFGAFSAGEDEPTSMAAQMGTDLNADPGGAVPLPGFGDGGAVPLPGFGANSSEVDFSDMGDTAAGSEGEGAIPLPGSDHPDAHGGYTPEPTQADTGWGAFPAEPEDAVPLPGQASAHSWNEPTQQHVEVPDFGAVPLPGGAYEEAAPPAYDAPAYEAPAYQAPAEAAPAYDPELPSFGNAPPIQESGWDIPPPAESDWDVEKTSVRQVSVPREAFGPNASHPAPAPASNLSAPPAAADDDVGFADADFADADFADADLVEPAAPAPVPEADPFAPVADAGPIDFNFDDLPAPGPAHPSPSAFSSPAAPEPSSDPMSFDISDLPSPANLADAPDLPVPAMSDLPSPAIANLPTPADELPDPLLDFATLPPPPQNTPRASVMPDPSADFGNVDLDVDLTSPIRPEETHGGGDALEELSFIDDAARGAGVGSGGRGGVRFHVRRRSGKIFGPFDEGVIVKMLEDGQLLGNEDISNDSEAWSPIGSNGSFNAAIQKLVQAPGGVGGATTTLPGSEAQRVDPSSPSMDKLRSLYEGRMAAVAVVDGSAARAKLRRRVIPVVIAVGVLLVLGAGASLQFTKYGAFGLKRLLPSHVSSGSADFASLQTAKKDLLQDTFQSYKEAKSTSDRVLAHKEFPQVRAVWAQAVFYLQRNYGASNPAELDTAKKSLEDLEVLGEKDPDYIKALAGSALLDRRFDEAISRLQAAWARDVSQEDVEVAFLLSEAYTRKGQPKAAIELLNRLLAHRKDSAKGLHALGNLYQAAGDADKAIKAYQDALAVDPQHATSSVELAAVQILLKKQDDAGLASLAGALDDEKTRAQLGPAEGARARALKGVALLDKNKVEEATTELKAAVAADKESSFAKVNLARALFAQRKFDEALPLFKDASGAEPSNLEYAEGYLTTLIAVSKFQDALGVVTGVNSKFPGNPRIAYLYGRVDDALDHSADAEAHYKRALASDPKMTEAGIALARFYLRFRRLPDAKAVLTDVEKRAPDSPEVNAGLGELLLAEGQLDDAQAAFDKAIKLDGSIPEAHLGLARVAVAKGDSNGARASAQKALSLDPHVKDGQLEQGTILWKLGQLDDALAALEKAKTDDPTNVRVAYTMGAVKLDKNDLAGAETNLLSALTTDPASPEANYYMARVKDRRGMFTQAIDSMKSALERAQSRADYHYELGNIYKDAQQFPDAFEEWKTAVKLNPNYSDALEAEGHLYLEQGKFDEATDSFKAALKAEPTRAKSMAALGDAYFAQAKWMDAVAHYQDALKADAKLKAVYYKIGRAFSEANQHDKAISWYQKATEIDADNAMPYYYLGFAFKERGKRKEAVGAFKEYLAKKPDADDKKEIGDEIYDLEHN